MCYLVAKKFNEVGCIAIKSEHGEALSVFKKQLYNQIKDKNIQLVTISKPSAYGEYEPYTFFDKRDDFEKMVIAL